MLTFAELQQQHAEWNRRNFGVEAGTPAKALTLIVEEFFELAEVEPKAERLQPFMLLLRALAHSHNKKEDRIRGTAAEHEAKMKDAIGDLTILLAFYCTVNGWDFQEVVSAAWGEVSRRDWRASRSGRTEGEQ